MKDIPIPAPRYNNAAINVDGISFKSILEIGVLMAYREAAKMAHKIEMLYFNFKIYSPI